MQIKTHISICILRLMLVQQRNMIVIWINPDELRDVIIHLKDFRAFLHFFSNQEKFATNSGFEEIVYLARICSVGGRKPVL